MRRCGCRWGWNGRSRCDADGGRHRWRRLHGIGLGIRLKREGLDDFLILERSNGLGGVWRENHYPGAACDVPSHLYSYSFAPRAEWPDKFARQADILDYLKYCARFYRLEPHIRFGAEISEAQWDDASSGWRVRTSDGRVFEAQALVTATGQLNRPSIPPLPGLDRFAGAAFHSAEWPQHLDLRGKQVAVIDTGASAIQIVPEIAPDVARLSLFQRSAAYVLPKKDKKYGSRPSTSDIPRYSGSAASAPTSSTRHGPLPSSPGARPCAAGARPFSATCGAV